MPNKCFRFLLKQRCLLHCIIYVLVVVTHPQELTKFKYFRLFHKLEMTFRRDYDAVDRCALLIKNCNV